MLDRIRKSHLTSLDTFAMTKLPNAPSARYLRAAIPLAFSHRFPFGGVSVLLDMGEWVIRLLFSLGMATLFNTAMTAEANFAFFSTVCLSMIVIHGWGGIKNLVLGEGS